MTQPDTAIPFTQYLRPSGLPTQVYIDLPQAVADKARTIIARGLWFECEVLRTGEVSFTITDPLDGDLDIRVVPNGPLVPGAVADLITGFKLEAPQ